MYPRSNVQGTYGTKAYRTPPIVLDGGRSVAAVAAGGGGDTTVLGWRSSVVVVLVLQGLTQYIPHTSNNATGNTFGKEWMCF
jgi:hypothetical protein